MFVAVAVLAIILGIVAYASAAGPDTVVVSATVNSKLDMTLSSTAYSFPGTFDPDAGPTTWNGMSVNVKSNKTYSFDKAWSSDTASAFSDDFVVFPVTAKHAKTSNAGADHTGVITFDPNYDITPGAYSASLQFTALQ